MIRAVLRRGKLRYLLLTGIAASVIVLLYQGFGGNITNSNTVSFSNSGNSNDINRPEGSDPAAVSASGTGGSKTAGLSAISKWLFSSGAQNEAADQCPLVRNLRTVDINTIDVYPTLNFKPGFRNYWNHSYDKRYLSQKENPKTLPLRVFVLPHSHNDPGWLKTFDGYFMSSTVFILNNMADRLNRYRDMTFVWSEISFFAKWWDSLKNRPQLREVVKNLVQRGQLEMVTGGWVMTDEAAAHYYAMIDQLIEGHQWLKTHLGVTPTNGWSIDPFGHSSTVPYLLRASGIKNMIIQRTHFAWKQYLAERQQLEFYWKQFFDKTASDNLTDKRSDILCHMAPFDLYSIKHTCGPDQDVCLQFDFRHVTGEYSESTSVQITDDNIEEKAKLLMGQYGRLGSLFPHNVALVFLGDDFRYNHDVEWDQQYNNYKKLFNYINERKDFKAEVSFGTVEDYFHEVRTRMAKLEKTAPAPISPSEHALPTNTHLPTLAGDFLPYGDIYADSRPSYWTGYYTTRPYWKHLTRELEYWLRSAEILYSLCRTVSRQKGNVRLFERLNQDYVYITTARDSLGLFQHHDAITGTSKADVMHDYGMRLYRGIREAIGVVSHAVQYVMLKEPIKSPIDLRPAHYLTSYLFPDVSRTSYDAYPQKTAYAIPKLVGRKIVVFNSLLHNRQEVVRVMVKSTNVKVIDANNQELQAQINPSWKGSVEILSGVFELVFVADLPPLSLQSLTLLEVKPQLSEPVVLKPTVSVFVNDAYSAKTTESVFSFINPSDEDIVLESPQLMAIFCKQTGLLKEMKHKNDADVKSKMTMTFQAYKAEDFRSGAYLFQPNRLQPILNVTGRFPIIRVIRGPLVSEVTTVYPGVVTLSSKIYHVDGVLGAALEMTTVFDIANFSATLNFELFMRLETDLLSENVFYTDSNGFQIIRRTALASLPVEANYYPITSAVYIEDPTKRLTLLTSHAHGATSQRQGWLEVMLDRRFRFDDARGLGEGVSDNKKTSAQFWLLLEKQGSSFGSEQGPLPKPKLPTSGEMPSLSHLGHTLSEMLNYPPNLLVAESGEDRPLESTMDFLEGSFPCDYHLVNLRTLPIEDAFSVPSNASLLVLHRKSTSCNVSVPSINPGCRFNAVRGGGVGNSTAGAPPVAMKNVRVRNMRRTSLTGIYQYEELQSLDQVQTEPANLQTYLMRFA